MLKILIHEADVMFRRGMKYFLSDFFCKRFNRQVEFIADYTPENIADADVIILSLCNGERYTCFPELRARRKGIIIGLVDENDLRERSPSCFADIVYIIRRAPLSEITHKLTVAWQAWLVSECFPRYKSCLGCKHIRLSLHQREVMTGLYLGRSIQEVAIDMNVTYKTVAAHKYIVMRKLSLKNDYDLFRFLGKLREKSGSVLFV